MARGKFKLRLSWKSQRKHCEFFLNLFKSQKRPVANRGDDEDKCQERADSKKNEREI